MTNSNFMSLETVKSMCLIFIRQLRMELIMTWWSSLIKLSQLTTYERCM